MDVCAMSVIFADKNTADMDFPYSSVPLDKALSVPCCRICIRHSRNRLRPSPLQVGMFGKPCLLLAIGYAKTETPERESLSKVIIYSILNKNTYYRLNRMSAVVPSGL